ncbi:MAG: hypothetical protein JNJ54_05620 [Myxococcaceae bacterium]|nr:hypothetical protein [Myxococcaceae bacterium]
MDDRDEVVVRVLRLLEERGRRAPTAQVVVELLRWCRPPRSLAAALARGALLEKHPLAATMVFAAAGDRTLTPGALWARGLAAERRVRSEAARARAEERREARQRRREVAGARFLLARARAASSGATSSVGLSHTGSPRPIRK